MKVLLISDEYPPSGGGAGVVAKQYTVIYWKNIIV